jgi:hypothetical protein
MESFHARVLLLVLTNLERILPVQLLFTFFPIGCYLSKLEEIVSSLVLTATGVSFKEFMHNSPDFAHIHVFAKETKHHKSVLFMDRNKVSLAWRITNAVQVLLLSIRYCPARKRCVWVL